MKTAFKMLLVVVFSVLFSESFTLSKTPDRNFYSREVAPDKYPLVEILDSKNISFDNLTIPEGTETAFKVDGPVTENVRVKNTDMSNAKAKEEIGDDVKAGAFQIK